MANEVWSEDNRMSELKEPISVDDMVEHMLGPINNKNLDFDGSYEDLTYEYHKSLAQCCIDPSKLFKVINQVQGSFEVASKEGRDAFINRERANPVMLRYPTPNDGDYRGKFKL